MFTIVSAFIDRTLYDPSLEKYRPVDFYLNHGKKLLRLDTVKKIIFLEKHVIEKLQPTIDECNPESITIIPFEKEELEYWPIRNKFLKCPLPVGVNPSKDTHDYFILMYNKVHWMKKACELNPYQSDYFIWMDFGLSYICKEDFSSNVMKMSTIPPKGRIRLPGCVIPQPSNPLQLIWYFCGGLFAGDKEAIDKFEKAQSSLIYSILSQGYVTWEVTIWFHIAMKEPTLFDRYFADHNDTMITKY